MSESESDNDSVDAVEVEPPKKKRPPISEERRKQMLENLAKGRKKRQENLSNKRIEKEQEDLKKQKQNACDYCGSEFKYKAS
jgi:shikimate kinase